jgi:hypothetical protein
MRLCRWAFALVACGGLLAEVSSCSLGTGSGVVHGELDVPDCWSGKFDLQPDFFAAVPYRSQVIFRVQSGGDYEAFSDGITVLVDDVSAVRAGLLGKPLDVSLPPAVVPPGTPVVADPNPPLVHFSLYLQRACRLETPALYALRDVTLNADGSCGGPSSPPTTCSSEAGSDASVPDAGAPGPLPTAHSTITFTEIFDGDPDEGDVAKRRTTASFDVYLADPREACAASNVPPRCRGHLTGSFDFLFQRGRPAQPFP